MRGHPGPPSSHSQSRSARATLSQDQCKLVANFIPRSQAMLRLNRRRCDRRLGKARSRPKFRTKWRLALTLGHQERKVSADGNVALDGPGYSKSFLLTILLFGLVWSWAEAQTTCMNGAFRHSPCTFWLPDCRTDSADIRRWRLSLWHHDAWAVELFQPV
jgi:hypothetical protein